MYNGLFASQSWKKRSRSRKEFLQLILCPISSSGGKNHHVCISLSLYFYPSKGLDHLEIELECIWNKHISHIFPILKNGTEALWTCVFQKNTVLQHVFLHYLNGNSAVLGANVSPAILTLSTAPQQYFSTQNYKIMAVYLFWSYTANIINEQPNLKIV